LKETNEQYEKQVEMYKVKYSQSKQKLSGERLELMLTCIKMKYESTRKGRKATTQSIIASKNK
jgi:hypothetical protein